MKSERWAHDDSGAALILAIIIVAVIAVVMPVVLGFGDASLKTSTAVRAQATTRYAADGAAQAAIDNLRNSTYNNGPSQQCFKDATGLLTQPTLYLNGFYKTPPGTGTKSAAVTCGPDPAAPIRISCPVLTNCNRPGTAILTLGNIAGEDGIRVTTLNSTGLVVHGTVISNSNIDATNASSKLVADTPVYARTDSTGSCGNGRVIGIPLKCPDAADVNTLGVDPYIASPANWDYNASTTTVPVYRSLPTCTTQNSVIKFLPGYYDDAAGLSSMMSSSSHCKNSIFWFAPNIDPITGAYSTGVYYFDFHNTENPLLGGNDQWLVNNGYVVAGTPLGWNPAAASVTPPVQPPGPAGAWTMPGACVSPITSKTAVGVQFIFGGDSQLVVSGGNAEICGTYDPSQYNATNSKLPLAVYGLRTGHRNVSPETTTPTSRSISDGVLVSGQKALTSANPEFTASDVGKNVSGLGIAAGTTVASFTSATSVAMSQNATATIAASATVAIGNPLKATAESGTDFSNLSNIVVTDGQYATWPSVGNGLQTGTLTTTGYTPSSAIPAGSILKAVTLRVVHMNNTAGKPQDNRTLTITPTGGSPITVTLPTDTDTAVHSDAIDLYGGGASALAQQVHSQGFTGASIGYSATVKHAGIESVDSIQLDLTYDVPTFRAEDAPLSPGSGTNCLNTTPYGSGSGPCALITSTAGGGGGGGCTPGGAVNSGAFYVQGTTYAPKAAMDITLNNAAEQVFRFGVVSRTLVVKETGSTCYTGPVIEVPDDSPGYAFDVFLNVYVCGSGDLVPIPGGGTGCPTPGNNPNNIALVSNLTAKVAFIDVNAASPISGQRQIDIDAWEPAH